MFLAEAAYEQGGDNTGFLRALHTVDNIATAFFAIEWVISIPTNPLTRFSTRLLVCPNKKKFLQDKMNLVAAWP